jgi:hypothetical protein
MYLMLFLKRLKRTLLIEMIVFLIAVMKNLRKIKMVSDISLLFLEEFQTVKILMLMMS